MKKAALVAAISLTAVAASPALPAEPQKAQKTAEATVREAEPTILSIVPAQGEPGTTVTLFGNAFTQGATAYLGTAPVGTRTTGPRQLDFEVPELPPGLYALYVQRDDGSTSRTYNFSVVAPKPFAAALSADRIYACSAGYDRELSVEGKNFIKGSQVLFDGAAVRTTFNSPESVTFTVPPLKGGLHQVQVRNPDGSVSGSLALFIDPKPEIRGVSQGEDRVSNYDLVIDGINFQQGSVVVVDGTRLSGGVYMDRDRILYVDCTKIIYQRHPYDTTTKTLRLQIMNPGGDESSVVQVNAP